jgi:hypothetical protein
VLGKRTAGPAFGSSCNAHLHSPSHTMSPFFLWQRGDARGVISRRLQVWLLVQCYHFLRKDPVPILALIELGRMSH